MAVLRRTGAVVLVLLTWGAVPSAASAVTPPVATALPRSSPDLDTLEAKAAALRDQLAGLEARAEWTHERLAQARGRLADATYFENKAVPRYIVTYVRGHCGR